MITDMRRRQCLSRGVGLAAALSGAAVLGGCSSLDLVNAASWAGAGSRREGLAFGPHARHRMDVYLPRGKAPEAGWTAVLFFYGGTWNRGERADYRFVGEALASRGLCALIADYRLYPEVRWPDFLEDGARAVAWTLAQARAGHLPLDPRRLHLMGHSAGAYNAAMLALDRRWLNAQGHSPADVAGWVGLAGPYDFLPIRDRDAQPVFHHPHYPPDTQPIALARAGAPRAFLAAASRDDLVNPQRSTVGLAQRLQTLGVPTTLRLYDGVDHITLIGALSRPLRWMAPVLDDITAFVAEGADRGITTGLKSGLTSGLTPDHTTGLTTARTTARATGHATGRAITGPG